MFSYPGLDRQIVWYQRNEVSIYPATLRLQGLESFLGQSRDPLLDRAFGAARARRRADQAAGPSVLRSVQPARKFDVQLHALDGEDGHGPGVGRPAPAAGSKRDRCAGDTRLGGAPAMVADILGT